MAPYSLDSAPLVPRHFGYLDMPLTSKQKEIIGETHLAVFAATSPQLIVLCNARP